MTERCAWAGNDPLYVHYHDTEWGVPTDDARTLFEFLVLEGAQAGLSWITVLRKRERYRAVFDSFDPERIVRYGDAKKAELLADPGIIRNRAKIDAAIVNARAWLDLQEAGTDPVAWLWSFVGGQPVQNAFAALGEIPATTPQSDAMSKALKARGFKFVGSTICYALMQAAGMTNDHVVSCPRHGAVTALARARGCA